jgi:hypothetical protein
LSFTTTHSYPIAVMPPLSLASKVLPRLHDQPSPADHQMPKDQSRQPRRRAGASLLGLVGYGDAVAAFATAASEAVMGLTAASMS